MRRLLLAGQDGISRFFPFFTLTPAPRLLSRPDNLARIGSERVGREKFIEKGSHHVGVA
jgi:hypothetical protein